MTYAEQLLNEDLQAHMHNILDQYNVDLIPGLEDAVVNTARIIAELYHLEMRKAALDIDIAALESVSNG